MRSDAGEDAYVDTGQDNGTTRVTIKEAATRLGVTDGAIRKRVQRGSIHSEMGDDGRVYVYLDVYQDASHPESQGNDGTLVEVLGDQVAYLREQLAEEREARRRADTIIAQLARANEEQARTIRELEPADTEGATDAPESASPDTSQGAGPHPQQAAISRPWWRRVFGD